MTAKILTDMLLPKISIAFRYIAKRKGFATINVLGLALGIAACLYISDYVNYHKSFDRQAPQPEQTFRVTYQRWTENGDRVEFASASPTIGHTMMRKFPEIDKVGVAYKVGGVFAHNDHIYEEEMAFYGETALLDILGFNIVQGSSTNCLDRPLQAVISEKLASKYFGKSNPIGQTLIWNGNNTLEVTAVYANLPSNTHFKPDLFVSLETWRERTPQIFESGWFYSGFYTYLTLKQGTSAGEIDRKIADFIETEFGETLREYKTGISFKLQPLLNIHLGSQFMHELEQNNDKSSIALLEVVAWFVLVIAWVNFFNISSISSLKRVKEIGIRKVNGATRSSLLMQLFLESAIVNLMAIVAAVILYTVGYPLFASLSGLPVNEISLTQPWFVNILTISMIVGTFSAGIYTVTGLNGGLLVNSLKGIAVSIKGNSLLKKSLITFQFAISIALIAGTLGVYKQLTSMRQADIGFNKDNLLVVKVPMVGDQKLHSKFWVFRDKASEVPSVKGVAYSSVVPGKPNMFNRGGIHRLGDDPTNGKNMRLTEVDKNFADVFGIVKIAGNGFTGNPNEDVNSVMLNKKGVEWLGFESIEQAIGSQIVLEGVPKTLVGVVVNFNQLSPKEEIEPQIFRYPERFQGYFTLRVEPKSLDKTTKAVEHVYAEVFPGNPFSYFFLDEFYGMQFKHDERFGMVFLLFSFLSIAITILGLFSLASFSAEQRKREISIRKVLGASNRSVLQLLSRDYLFLWLVACSVAIPVSFYWLNQWLSSYATRISIGLTIFVIPILIVALVTILTVIVQSLRVVSQNPVESIRTD